MVVAVILARLLVPFAIPRFPLPAIVAALLLDGIDQTVFELAGVADLSGYQTYDKALDIYYLVIAYAATIRNWDGPAFEIGRALWYYRLVGVVLFEYTEARWLLLVFPNTFEYFFIAVELIKVSRNPFALARRQLVTLAAGIWIVIKLPQEWWLHIAQLDLTDLLAKYAGGPGGAYVALGLTAAAGMLAVVGRRALRHLPPRDWPPTISADEQSEHLGWPAPPDEARPSAFFGWPFVEKAILVTLVTLIFEQILPGATRSLPQVAAATTLIIALSTVLSRWLATRGLTWGSAAAELIVMGFA
ncbi:MAG: hypothetical protein M3Y31_04425, partial [Gemmatimonadota bacterium]|nr:hypothetical protein [Gemmatimonadota bacterium]